jgi:transcriptional regulator with XRE-family HTH domain
MADNTDPVMLRAREIFKESGKTLVDLGLAMGSEGEVARKSAWQFLNKTSDPRFSMLRRFASAMGISIEDLVGEKKKKKAKKK